MPCSTSLRISPRFLRTFKQMSGTRAAGVESFRLTKTVAWPGGRIALQVVEVRRLLELALEAVSDLLERVADRSAGSPDLHHHGLDGEVRILAAPEPQVGPDARDHDD